MRISQFSDLFSSAIASVPFVSFFWETPALTSDSLHTPFECVVIDAPSLQLRQADPTPFATQFVGLPADSVVIAFDNLGGDSMLVVPVNKRSSDNYGHLASFLRSASRDQIRETWRLVAVQAELWLSREQACWISTAGMGVAWLHIRIDSRPKYYSYAPYRSI